MADFEELPLHDAVLYGLKLQWKESKAELSLSVFIERGKPAVPHNLIFFGVKDVSCPHLSPWGDSSCINDISELSGVYKIEMQSGDVLTFKSEGFEFKNVTL